MAKKIRFGGPALPDGKSTWYMTRVDGALRQIRAEPGHVVDADAVLGNGGQPNAEYYIDRCMAVWESEKRSKSARKATV